MSSVNILCIGDVVGKPGYDAVIKLLAELIESRNIQLVVCNAENADDGSGLTPLQFRRLIDAGVDVITMGDHVYRRKELVQVLEGSPQIVRPANLAATAAGKRWTAVTTKDGSNQVAVAVALGQMYMKPADSPWTTIERLWKEIPADIRIRVLDFHAEATSEKIAMGWNLDGRASVVFGTHTHVPTADAHVLPQGLAYITDVGMTGPYDSVLGRNKNRVLRSLHTTMPVYYDVASKDIRLCGVLATIDSFTGKATACERVEVPYEKKQQ